MTASAETTQTTSQTKETVKVPDTPEVKPYSGDASNPQQGGSPHGDQRVVTAAPRRFPHPRPSLKIPPTTKDDRKLFVGGLPSDVTNEEFTEFFGRFGKLIDSIVMFDYHTGRSRGFGFVTYEDPSVARHLLSLGQEHNAQGDDNTNNPDQATGRVQMRDKLVEIKASQPKQGRGGGRGGGTSPREQGGGGRSGGGGGDGQAIAPSSPMSALPKAQLVDESVPSFTYPNMDVASYGYCHPMPPYGQPGVYCPTPAPYPAGYVPGYVSPLYFPNGTCFPESGEAPIPFGYALVPIVPSPFPPPPPTAVVDPATEHQS